ncbi:MAG TPA: DUF4864 domain-containing protein [Marinobacter adhaerens]|jgi:flagellar hook-length control protein FliK|uniref:DUF4864 domain-containing protein n=1 Tax=unclassified Marinobacter TaxID=83889 RepID=UPI00069FDAEE|nr:MULTISPECIES: DUF4864 domain-containing protein [unclassified Marinobacter]AKV96314.1 hypothetical protein ACP86_09185 [Marinobacter sp. CP1]HAS76112.1 DUF4864 domain-containing protein [Marinobacter adhaerens]|tara:strand:+ start:6848 stop:7288 length:441 start_codon:yes stop_codon:yes gene_type:complete
MGHQHIVSGKWLIPVLLAFIGFAVLGSPQSVASDKDAEIRDTILRQIEAFANNDEEQAWAHASEGIKRRFGSSQVFVDMVREAYPAVHHATAIEFTQRVPHGAFEIQVVRLQGPEGKRWDAYYRMVLTEGVWKVAGVRLQPAELGI